MDARVRDALLAVRALAAEELAVLAGGRREEVARWRRPALGSVPHHPEPWAGERAGCDPRWAMRDDHGVWVGLDASGRPVLAELRRDSFGDPELPPEPFEVWFHGEGWSDVRTRDGVRRILFDEDRATWVVAFEGVVTVERWSWRGGVAVRGDIANVADDWRSAETYAATVDDLGRLELLMRGYRQAESAEADEEVGLQASLKEAARLEPDQVVYDARIHRHEPQLRPTEQLTSLLPVALEDAVVAAVAASGVERPFVVEVSPGPFDAFRPFCRVGGERFRERMVALSPTPEAAVELLHEAEPPDGATVELVDFLDDDAARACREITAAVMPHSDCDERDQARASAALGQIGQKLAARLNSRDWPDTAEPFLALVNIAERYTGVDPSYLLAAEAVGAERVAHFRASLQPAMRVVAAPADARGDRAALEALLAGRGLASHAHRLAFEVAQVGLRLHGTRRARSRLGGPPLLSPGGAWPHDDNGRPLTFLAAIDLTELPERGPLPAEGWLLFFANLDPDGGGLIDEAINQPGAEARVLALAASADPLRAAHPAAVEYRLNERRVAFEPQLTLPDGYAAAAELGLDPAEGEAYNVVASWLRYGEDGPRHDRPDHWMLSAVTGEQGHSPAANTVLLLHLSPDEALGFEFQDAGTIQFRIPADALAAGDWTAARALAESG